MPHVYISQDNSRRSPDGEMVRVFDFTPAAMYGELVTLLPAHPIPHDTSSIIDDLRAALIDYSDGDFILPSGDPVAMGLAMMVAAEMNDGRVTVLRWNKLERGYFPVKINMRWGGEDDQL